MGQYESGVMEEIEVAELQEMYKKFVVECPSGALHLHEFKHFFNISDNREAEEYADNVFREFDKNRDNAIDFLEYVAALNLVLRGKLEHKLKWSFKVYDRDGDGSVDRKELKEIIKSIYRMKNSWNRDEEVDLLTVDEVCDRIFQLVDDNRDGKLSLTEFVEGAKKDTWVMKMLHLEMVPYSYLLERRRKRAMF